MDNRIQFELLIMDTLSRRRKNEGEDEVDVCCGKDTEGGAGGDGGCGDVGKRRVVAIGVGVYTQCKRGMLCSDWLFA